MSTKAITGLCVLGGLVAVALVLVGSYVSAYNYGNEAEKSLTALLNDNKQILGQYSNKVVEIAQVPEMKKNDLVEVTEAAMQGRYGEDGSGAMFQWIQENYPGAVTDTLYQQLQQVMEAGRNEFQGAQTRLLDHKRTYETNLGYLWRGTWLSIAGYPKINLDEIKVLTSSYSDQSFDAGKTEAIQLGD